MKESKGFIVVAQRVTPRCSHADCVAKENPEHWVDVYLGEPVVNAIKGYKEFVENELGGDEAEPETLRAILTDLRALLKQIDGKPL